MKGPIIFFGISIVILGISVTSFLTQKNKANDASNKNYILKTICFHETLSEADSTTVAKSLQQSLSKQDFQKLKTLFLEK